MRQATRDARTRTVGAERRRRQRHFRRLRRDLLEDTGLALVLTIALVSVTSGLGILVLIEVPVACALLVSGFAGRMIRARSRPGGAGPRPR